MFTFEHDKYIVVRNDIWIEAKGVEKNYLNMIINTLAKAGLGGCDTSQSNFLHFSVNIMLNNS